MALYCDVTEAEADKPSRSGGRGREGRERGRGGEGRSGEGRGREGAVTDGLYSIIIVAVNVKVRKIKRAKETKIAIFYDPTLI